jgi:CO/xanthine dehydrogenase Mo-binding subunit
MSLIGAAVTRSDAAAKVQGRAVYGVDHQEVGMLHGVLLRSPVPAGRIRRLDTDAARAMPGVHVVCSAADQPDTLGGWVIRDQRLFATGEVRFEGEAVALVVAETREQAAAAAAAIDLDIEVWEGVDLARAGAADARLVHPHWETYLPAAGPDYPRQGNLAAELRSEPEGVEEAFAAAAHVVEDRFTANRQYQAYLEPKAAVAEYSGGRYTIHTSVQHPYNVRERVAQLLGVRVSAVRVVGKTIGGGFGGKLDASVEPMAAFAAKLTGRPVKIRNERTEDMLTCPSRENVVMTVRTALAADGTMLGRELICDMDNGAYSAEMPWLASLPLSIIGSVYRIDGPVRVISRLWYTNTAPTGAFRGVGGLYLYMALERHTDHIAETLGVDRRDYRLQHLFKDGDGSRTGQVFPDAGILAEAFAELETKAPWAEVTAGLKPWQGVGIAAGIWMTNPMPGQATVKVNEDGTVHVLTGANDNGSGAVTMGITQIVAESLGLDTKDVMVSMPDTDVSGYDAGSQGSRTTHIVGRAALDASLEVRRQLLAVAGDLIEADPDDLEIVDGTVRVAGAPSRSVSLAQVATTATWTVGPIAATSSYTSPPIPFDPGCASGLLFSTMSTPTYHVHMAVVEVDPVTGSVRVLRYIVVQEVGRVINPVGVRGQIQGAVAQGLGYSLYESLRIDDDCRYIERTLESYRLPLAIDMPDVEIVTMEHPDAAGPYGAKGVAEPPITLVPAAIATAVSNAIGAPISAIPVTPEDILAALEARA